MEELKTCPFCGEVDSMHIDHEEAGGFGVNHDGYFRARCRECGASSRKVEASQESGRGVDEAQRKVVEAWNTRA